jgi:hypothetical protein
MRRTGESSWHEPKTQRYQDEAALQELLALSPGLIPGVDPERALVAREVHLGEGYLDVLVVEATGVLTLVECKLRTNPEIRRTIVGQLLSYAAGLWKLSVAEFEERLRSRGVDLSDLSEQATTAEGGAVGYQAVQDAVAARLASGDFRIVVAVDNFTAELRSIVEYLNAHTSAGVEVLGLELAFVADEGIEVLVPRVYGDEAVRAKASTSPRTSNRWTEEDLHSAITEAPEGTRVALLALYESTPERAEFDHWYWGDGKTPSITPWLVSPGGFTQPWSLYTGEDGDHLLAINFDWISRRGRGFGTDVIERFADRIAALPGAARHVQSARDATWRKRPSLSANELFSSPDSLSRFQEALDELYGDISGLSPTSTTRTS